MKKPLLIIFALLSVFAFYGCPKDDVVKPDPIDPCQEYKDTKAKIITKAPCYDKYFPNDTMLESSEVVFRAEGKFYTDWSWYIGEETTARKDDFVKIQFTEPYGYIPIKLIATRPPLPDCNDDGIDTIESFVYIKPFDKSSIIGEYLGYTTDDTTSKYIVKIFFLENQYRMTNVNKGFYDTIPDLPFIATYPGNNVLQFSSDAYANGCECPKGTAVVSRDLKTIEINYTVAVRSDGSRKPYCFKGVRI